MEVAKPSFVERRLVAVVEHVRFSVAIRDDFAVVARPVEFVSRVRTEDLRGVAFLHRLAFLVDEFAFQRLAAADDERIRMVVVPSAAREKIPPAVPTIEIAALVNL